MSLALSSLRRLVVTHLLEKHLWAIVTHLFVLVSIAVTALSKCLVTVLAGVGSSALVGAHMVDDVAELVELLAAGKAV